MIFLRQWNAVAGLVYPKNFNNYNLVETTLSLSE